MSDKHRAKRKAQKKHSVDFKRSSLMTRPLLLTAIDWNEFPEL